MVVDLRAYLRRLLSALFGRTGDEAVVTLARNGTRDSGETFASVVPDLLPRPAAPWLPFSETGSTSRYAEPLAILAKNQDGIRRAACGPLLFQGI
jgi:hypothetical protein